MAERVNGDDGTITQEGPSGARILLICPDFFAYPRMMSDAFRALGYEVDLLGDRPSGAALYKALLRILPASVGAVSASWYAEALRELPADHYRHVVVVKGEALTAKTVAWLRAKFNRARFSLYLWDSVTNVRNARKAAEIYDSVSTFDPSEAELFGWCYRPLFAATRSVERPERSEYDWSFIGSIHSDRAKIIRRFRSNLPYDTRGFVFGYFPSWLVVAGQCLRDPGLVADTQSTWSLKPMSRDDYIRIAAASRAVLDLEHPKQSGLTMRTIETLMSGIKLITTNRMICGSALCEPSRVCVIDRHCPTVPESFFHVPVEPLPPEVVYAYSAEAWARDLLGLPQNVSSLRY